MQAIIAAAALLVVAVSPVRAQGQSFGPAGPGDGPPWLVQWSAIANFAESRREPLGAALVLPRLLELPAPKSGLFWTAGNPGAIPWEIDAARAEFTAATGTESGDYRRPLEPGRASTLALSASGWQPLGERGAGIGRIVFEDVELGDGARFNVARPYGANPLTIVDTAGEDLTRLRVRLEGAGGWRIGPLGLGLAGGYAAHETRTEASNVPRVNRLAYTGFTAGAVYRSDGGFTVGVHARIQDARELVQVRPLETGRNRVYLIDGYRDPSPREIVSPSIYTRYLDTEASGFGVSVGGGSGQRGWVLSFETGNQEEVGRPDRSSDAPLDIWDADSRGARAAVRLPLFGFASVVQAGWSSLEGSAHVAEFDLTVHTAEDTRMHLDADLRRSLGEAWELGLRWRTERSVMERADSIADVGSEVRSWTHAASFEVAHAVSSSLRLSGGGGLGWFSPGGSIPVTSELGPVYQRFIAPGLYVDGTSASLRAFSLGAMYGSGEGPRVRASLRWRGVSPSSGDVVTGVLPDGDRSEWGVSLGVVLRGG